MTVIGQPRGEGHLWALLSPRPGSGKFGKSLDCSRAKCAISAHSIRSYNTHNCASQGWDISAPDRPNPSMQRGVADKGADDSGHMPNDAWPRKKIEYRNRMGA